MTNTRTIKELLTVMLENQQLFRVGLCFWVDYLFRIDIITDDECNNLHNYIGSNKPITLFRIFTSTNYYWKLYDIKPRIKWIKRHIKKNS